MTSKNICSVGATLLLTLFWFNAHAQASREPGSTGDPSSRSAVRETDKELPIAEDETSAQLTGNWGGTRKRLSDKGFDLALIYKFEVNSVLSGGLQTATTTLGNVDLRVGLDLDKMAGMTGSSFFIYVLGNHGGDPSRNIGDSQVTSNIETPVSAVKIYELWFQKLAFDDKVSFLAGLHDLNSEFYTTESSSVFFNSTFGVGKELSQTGANGPSIFPTTAPSLRVRSEPSASLYLQAAAFNGTAGNPQDPYGTYFRLQPNTDGILLISEIAYLRGKQKDAQELGGKYGFGYWTYTSPSNHLIRQIGTDGSGNPIYERAVNHGMYFLADQRLSQSVSLFLRYGIASSQVNRFDSSLGTGALFSGLIPGRENDRLGIAVASVHNGGEYKTAQEQAGSPVSDAETTVELTYRAELRPGLVLQPDFQYVISPGTAPGVPSAAVIAARLEMSL